MCVRIHCRWFGQGCGAGSLRPCVLLLLMHAIPLDLAAVHTAATAAAAFSTPHAVELLLFPVTPRAAHALII